MNRFETELEKKLYGPVVCDWLSAEKEDQGLAIHICCDIIAYWDSPYLPQTHIHGLLVHPLLPFSSEIRCRRSADQLNVTVPLTTRVEAAISAFTATFSGEDSVENSNRDSTPAPGTLSGKLARQIYLRLPNPGLVDFCFCLVATALGTRSVPDPFHDKRGCPKRVS